MPWASEVRGGPVQARDRVRTSEGRPELGEGHPAGHVDGHVEVLPADLLAVVVMHLRGPSATTLEAAEALDVDTDELAGTERRVCPEAPRRLGEQMAEPLGVVAAEDPVDGARVHSQLRPDAVGTIPRVHPQREHGALERSRRAPR